MAEHEQASKWPKEGENYMRQLADPLGMVFNQANSEHKVEVFHNTKVDSLWHDLEVCMVSYYDNILIYKIHGT